MNFLLWFVYYPLLKLASLLVFWVPKIQERIKFEKKNRDHKLCSSFSEANLKADFCFEFSSEGEYQQVAGLIDDALKAGKCLELCFFSPSVEKTIVNLAQMHPSQLRYLRYPLVTFSPWRKSGSIGHWMTSDKLIMVRYDLFPELLLWSMHPKHELTILWTSFKKERVRQKNISWLKRAFLRHTKNIFYASLPDQQMGIRLGYPGPSYDFRMEQIRRRIAGREDKFKTVFHQYPGLKANWAKYPRHKRVIIGNAWPSDLFLLEKLPHDVFVLVVPHQLSPEIIGAFMEAFVKLGRNVLEIKDQTGEMTADTVILNKKGVLCELYADFDYAYVGGGFETSVHSLLEPLVAGASAIACGTIHHRSTEYDVAHSMGLMTEVRSASDFLSWIEKKEMTTAGAALSKVFENYEKYRKDVISC